MKPPHKLGEGQQKRCRAGTARNRKIDKGFYRTSPNGDPLHPPPQTWLILPLDSALDSSHLVTPTENVGQREIAHTREVWQILGDTSVPIQNGKIEIGSNDYQGAGAGRSVDGARRWKCTTSSPRNRGLSAASSPAPAPCGATTGVSTQSGSLPTELPRTPTTTDTLTTLVLFSPSPSLLGSSHPHTVHKKRPRRHCGTSCTAGCCRSLTSSSKSGTFKTYIIISNNNNECWP